jgi:hypothetical protein
VRNITLEIAFVIDATGSMQKWIDETLAAVSRLAREIAAIPALKGKVRLALVCYRDSPLDYQRDDYVPPDNYLVRKYCDLDEGRDHGVFLEQLHTVRAEGGGQTPERVLDGLDSAIRELAWSPDAYKHIILIGNASTHTDPAKSGGLTIDRVRQEAQPGAAGQDPARAITIHAIQVPSKEKGDPDSAKCRDQFTALAQGVHYRGVFEAQDQLDQFSRDLLTLIRGRLKYITQLVSGDNQEEVIRSARSDRLIGPLLAMIEAGRGQKGFATGYVAEVDLDGHRQIEPYLLVRRDQLETFNNFLDLFVKVLQSANDPGGPDVESLVRSLKEQLSLLQIGESFDLNTPTREVLGWILDAPVRDPLFDVTPLVLSQWSQEQFRDWREKVAGTRARASRQLEDLSAWVHLGRETRPDRMHSFIRMVDLP